MNGTQLSVGLTNTWTLTGGQLYFVDHPAGHCQIRNVAVANKEGNLWIRLDGQDAAVGNEDCLLIPVETIEYDINFYGPISMISESDTTITLRCW